MSTFYQTQDSFQKALLEKLPKNTYSVLFITEKLRKEFPRHVVYNAYITDKQGVNLGSISCVHDDTVVKDSYYALRHGIETHPFTVGLDTMEAAVDFFLNTFKNNT